jgi:hypothetical protein
MMFMMPMPPCRDTAPARGCRGGLPMGVQTDVVMGDLRDAQGIADSATPTTHWPGFTFHGFHNVKLCSLLSLLKTGRADADFERYLDLVDVVSAPTEDGPLVFAVRPAQTAELAVVAAFEEAEFESLTASWAATEEFAGWTRDDVRELLRALTDLAETASLEGKSLFLWQSL